MPERRKKQPPGDLPAPRPKCPGPPTVRLAHVPGAQGDNNLLGQRGVSQLPPESYPALLVSFVYIKTFFHNRHRYAYRDWALDSGAFSARSLGVEINLQEYIDLCKRLRGEDPTLRDIFALDVIGDWRATMKNTEAMWRKGIEAIPCYHLADNDWGVLKGMARDYPKIAIGGMADLRGNLKRRFVEQCFARVWPKKMHGFGCSSETMVMSFPWHSVDATNWEIAPCKFGTWRAFGGQRVSVRGSDQNLRAEVEWYLELERRARERWRKEMAKLEGETPGKSPVIALAISDVQKSGNTIQQIEDALRPRKPPGGR